jgi:hypothetical protein
MITPFPLFHKEFYGYYFMSRGNLSQGAVSRKGRPPCWGPVLVEVARTMFEEEGLILLSDLILKTLK